jgi:hypothetical protein
MSSNDEFFGLTRKEASALLYFETVCVDRLGRPDPKRMNQADFNALDKFEADGLIVNEGTGANPLLRLTDAGWRTAGALRRARAERAAV